MYSWVFIENNILTPLRKDKYDINYLVSLEISEIIPLWLALKNRQLLEAADYWFDRKLDEIESESNKPIEINGKTQDRSEVSKAQIRKELYDKYFGVDLEK